MKLSSGMKNRGFSASDSVSADFLALLSVSHRELQKSLVFHFSKDSSLEKRGTASGDRSYTFKRT